jgi:hypothetical protein
MGRLPTMILSVADDEFEQPIWSDDDPKGLDKHERVRYDSLSSNYKREGEFD